MQQSPKDGKRETAVQLSWSVLDLTSRRGHGLGAMEKSKLTHSTRPLLELKLCCP